MTIEFSVSQATINDLNDLAPLFDLYRVFMGNLLIRREPNSFCLKGLTMLNLSYISLDIIQRIRQLASPSCTRRFHLFL